MYPSDAPRKREQKYYESHHSTRETRGGFDSSMRERESEREREEGFQVYVGNLGNRGDEKELRHVFERYGEVLGIFVARQPPGFAFVKFERLRDAEEAVDRLDGAYVCGHTVTVSMSHGRSRWPGGRVPEYVLQQRPPRRVASPPPLFPSASQLNRPRKIPSPNTRPASPNIYTTYLPLLQSEINQRPSRSPKRRGRERSPIPVPESRRRRRPQYSSSSSNSTDGGGSRDRFGRVRRKHARPRLQSSSSSLRQRNKTRCDGSTKAGSETGVKAGAKSSGVAEHTSATSDAESGELSASEGSVSASSTGASGSSPRSGSGAEQPSPEQSASISISYTSVSSPDSRLLDTTADE